MMEATIKKPRKRKMPHGEKSRKVREAITHLGKGASAAAIRDYLAEQNVKVSDATIAKVRANGKPHGNGAVFVDIGRLFKAKQAIATIGTIQEAKQAILWLEKLGIASG